MVRPVIDDHYEDIKQAMTELEAESQPAKSGRELTDEDRAFLRSLGIRPEDT
jgi:hypothetical protein